VVRRCVRSRNLVNKEALANWGLLCQIKKKIQHTSLINSMDERPPEFNGSFS